MSTERNEFSISESEAAELQGEYAEQKQTRTQSDSDSDAPNSTGLDDYVDDTGNDPDKLAQHIGQLLSSVMLNPVNKENEWFNLCVNSMKLLKIISQNTKRPAEKVSLFQQKIKGHFSYFDAKNDEDLIKKKNLIIKINNRKEFILTRESTIPAEQLMGELRERIQNKRLDPDDPLTLHEMMKGISKLNAEEIEVLDFLKIVLGDDYKTDLRQYTKQNNHLSLGIFKVFLPDEVKKQMEYYEEDISREIQFAIDSIDHSQIVLVSSHLKKSLLELQNALTIHVAALRQDKKDNEYRYLLLKLVSQRTYSFVADLIRIMEATQLTQEDKLRITHTLAKAYYTNCVQHPQLNGLDSKNQRLLKAAGTVATGALVVAAIIGLAFLACHFIMGPMILKAVINAPLYLQLSAGGGVCILLALGGLFGHRQLKYQGCFNSEMGQRANQIQTNVIAICAMLK